MNQAAPVVHQGITVKSVCYPQIPADDRRFVWTAGADVQSVWRRFGWIPLDEQRKPSNDLIQ
jgi:hypothetical protein